MSHTLKYTIGWICAIQLENVAAISLLDERHPPPRHLSPKDNKSYTLGKLGGHNLVIATPPSGQYGIAAAACVARDLVHSFPNVRFGLVVGIGGGVPTQQDIRLGDVVVGNPGNGTSGLFHYDYGRTVQNQPFQTTGHVEKPPYVLRTAVSRVQAEHQINGNQIQATIDEVCLNSPRLTAPFSKPAHDLLYRSDVVHPYEQPGPCVEVCGVETSALIVREDRDPVIYDGPTVHYGLIASSNQLMKDAIVRDRLATTTGVLCFDMWAAGLANHFPCLVVRGISNYADSHIYTEWEGYVAIAAAAYAKELLEVMVPCQVESGKRVEDMFSTAIEQSLDQIIYNDRQN